MSKHTSVSALACCLQCKKEYEVLTPDSHICGQMEMDLSVSVEHTLQAIEKEECEMDATVETKEPQVTRFKRGYRLENTGIDSLDQAFDMYGAEMKKRYGIVQPKFRQFVGDKATMIDILPDKKAFLVFLNDGKKKWIPFTSSTGRYIILTITVILPAVFSKFEESDVYKAADAMHLSGFLTSKQIQSGKQTRDTIIMGSLTLDDIYVASGVKILGKLRDFSPAELDEQVFEERMVKGKKKYLPRKGIWFTVAKDVRTTNVGSLHAFFRKQTGSLNYMRFAWALKKKVEKVLVAKTYKDGGIATSVMESVSAIVLDEMCVFDASGPSLPFGERNQAVLSAVFTECSVIHSEDGTLPDDVSELKKFKTYKTYSKSPSQDRNSSANGFDALKSVVTYFLGTGQTEKTYATRFEVTDSDGKKHKTCYNVVDVGAAYKRYMVGASNGVTPTKGLLSTFTKGHKVEYVESGKGLVIGDIKPEYYKIRNKDGELLTIATVEDFTFRITKDHPFLVNILDENNAMVGVEEFSYWDEEAAAAILERNLTDGQGWVNSRIIDALRSAGCLNSFDAFQGRALVGCKGAFYQMNEICDALQADIVLTKGMIKSKNFLEDLRKNGFQLFVVGQRKDGQDGVWAANQATQHYRMTADELKLLVDQSISFARKSVDDMSVTELLTMLNEGGESNWNVTDFVKLATEQKGVLNEQWIMNEVKSLVVRELNKLLDAKLFVKRARNRYMFTDPIALLRAIKAGRYELTPEDAVLQPYQVVTPSKKEDGTFFMEEGEAVCSRFPKGAPHESPVVEAVDAPEYREYVANGLWQGCVFFDIFSWIVALMSGADHDGDACIVLFEDTIVAAVKRLKKKPFGELPLLPLIDSYVVRDREGQLVRKMDKNGKMAAVMGNGCPTYVPENQETVLPTEWEEVGPFLVNGNQIVYDPKDFTGQYAEVNRRLFLELQAELAHEITVKNIEKSHIGIIANRIMIVTDLLSRNVLTASERLLVEKDSIHLCVGGKFEIDRPKKGGAYMEMPLFKELFAWFSPIHFNEEQMAWDLNKKKAFLAQEKLHYRHVFAPIYDWKAEGKEKPVIGFEVKKPEWLASQKAEYGEYHEDSLYQQMFGTARGHESYALTSIKNLCVEFKKGHNNKTSHNMDRLIRSNMMVDDATFDSVQRRVAVIYSKYAEREGARRGAEEFFRENHIKLLREAKVFGKKNIFSLTRAKFTAKIRKAWPEKLEEFSIGRELLKTLLRKELYEVARELGVDIRVVVGVLYFYAGQQGTKGKADWRKDGREIRFAASNGFIHLPFEVFSEEMYSLISGPVGEVPFYSQNLSFTMVQGSLFQQVRVKVMKPNQELAGKSYGYRVVRAAVRKEQQPDGKLRLVMNFLNKNAQVTDLHSVTAEHTAFRGFPRQEMAEGFYNLEVWKIQFDESGASAVINYL